MVVMVGGLWCVRLGLLSKSTLWYVNPPPRKRGTLPPPPPPPLPNHHPRALLTQQTSGSDPQNPFLTDFEHACFHSVR